ncbi:MAG: hypothetical protein KUG72_12745 [Pseudomonadales bacterium]|nr:hypothetical protein [Pseudomonadales bacterium]
MKTNRLTLMILMLFVGLLTSACASEQTEPVSYAIPSMSKFDRAWIAAQDAFADQGVKITSSDRSTGVIQGTRDEITLTTTLNQRADGSIEIKFNSSGKTSNDPDLIRRVSHAYSRSMGH